MTTSAEQPSKLMDAKAIMSELGVTRAAADAIIRWCNENGQGALRPADGARKLYVYRADVEAWERASNTRSAA